MRNQLVYLDNHATTRVDPRVVEAMLPFFDIDYGNAGSISHAFGWAARDAVDAARESLAQRLGASAREVVFTSGATESNNLAIRGVAERGRRKGNHLVSVQTEHKAVLDPLRRLSRRGYDVTLLPVERATSECPGWLAPERVEEAIRDDTVLVSVMLANNEIGVIQPIQEMARVCRQRNVLLHCDATQAVGKIPVHFGELGVDLLSFSAHKLYGPKGVGALLVRRQGGRTRLEPQVEGGGQEGGLRSGTLNVPGIVGLARAVELCVEEMDSESVRLAELRDHLYQGLVSRIDHLRLNGPPLTDRGRRLAGNLNVSFAWVDGEALMMNMRDVAVSSGSACTSSNPEPSHVLRGLGLDDDAIRASLRMGLGRFTTQEEVDFAVEAIAETVTRLRKLSSLA
jgi:cysteine desulfurase